MTTSHRLTSRLSELLLGAAELGELAAARELVISGLGYGHLQRAALGLLERVRVRVMGLGLGIGLGIGMGIGLEIGSESG